MPVPDWIEAAASALLDTTAELRQLVRRSHYDPDARWPYPSRLTTRAGKSGGITIGANEARTLLRAAMPVPIGTTRLRQPHARMLAALQLYAGHLLGLNDPLHDPAAAIAAAITLRGELDTWLTTARWQQACRAASVRWPLAVAGNSVAVTTVLRQQTDASREQAANEPLMPALTVTGLAAGHRGTHDEPQRWLDEYRARANGAKNNLQLPEPASAQVLPLRKDADRAQSSHKYQAADRPHAVARR